MAPAIPTRDADLDAYTFNWKTLLTAAPATYGLVAGDATAISTAYTTFHAQYVICSNLLTRTAAAVLAKDIAKASMLVLLRTQYRLIKANPAVLDVNKESIGVRVNDPVPTPIPPPSTFPLISVTPSAPLEQSIMAVDSATPLSRAKPPGAVGLLVVRAIGTVPAVSPEACDFMGMYTRVPFIADPFDSGDAGKIATYFARWTNAKGQEGPWSAQVFKTITN